MFEIDSDVEEYFLNQGIKASDLQSITNLEEVRILDIALNMRKNKFDSVKIFKILENAFGCLDQTYVDQINLVIKQRS